MTIKEATEHYNKILDQIDRAKAIPAKQNRSINSIEEAEIRKMEASAKKLKML